MLPADTRCHSAPQPELYSRHPISHAVAGCLPSSCAKKSGNFAPLSSPSFPAAPSGPASALGAAPLRVMSLCTQKWDAEGWDGGTLAERSPVRTGLQDKKRQAWPIQPQKTEICHLSGNQSQGCIAPLGQMVFS